MSITKALRPGCSALLFHTTKQAPRGFKNLFKLNSSGHETATLPARKNQNAENALPPNSDDIYIMLINVKKPKIISYFNIDEHDKISC